MGRLNLIRHSGEGRNLPQYGTAKKLETPAFAGVTLACADVPAFIVTTETR